MGQRYNGEESVVRLLGERQFKDRSITRVQRKLQVTEELVARLGLEAELEGHAGCVNCLEWNQKGEILASGSDDVQIMLWDPFRHRRLHTIPSGHHGNIFSIKFLPYSGDSLMASGAADFKIRVHDIHARETTMVCSCHTSRVKRLATAASVPFVFWSAAEDGVILQFDYRTPHQCTADANHVLVNLGYHLGRNVEAKCIAVNQLQPHLVAVGANDSYIRLYDRRMINTTKLTRFNSSSKPDVESDNLPPGCVTYFAAGHLPLKYPRKRYRTLASTYVAFSPDGSELLANLGGEQIYLFNINHPRQPKSFDLQSFTSSLHSNGLCKNLAEGGSSPANGFSTHKNGISNGMVSNGMKQNGIVASTDAPPVSSSTKWGPANSKPLPPHVEAIKCKANEKFGKQKYTLAIDLYNKAIRMVSDSPVLYCNRAAAFMKRAWDGDMYAALRDCHTSLQLEADYVKAHLRLVRCLYELRWTKEALDCLQAFKSRFPDCALGQACQALDRDIKAAIFSKTENDSEEGSRSESQSSNGSANSSPKHRRQPQITEQEKAWRAVAYDYEQRFCGHCNTTTDIKEANFFGSAGQFVVAGSDDGSFFVWDKQSTNLVRVMRGDDSIVNCLQPHPSTCLLATSGIDPVVRLWSPKPEDGKKEDREVVDSEDAAVANQRRMNADPLEVMLMNMGYRVPGLLESDEVEVENRSGESNVVSCRPS
ncbi:WD and tetratricopeptide repeats 1 [Dermacentor variabilis]|uniref:WD and tetratricopeptide repeats 1 n=1 Tax=Dermacentor variabilis TaxID=34621 RepID=UPI003F5C55A4